MSDLAERAEVVARSAHAGQVDKQGRDYAEHHLAPVAEILRPFGPEAEAAGWLHDILEDTDWTAEDLAEPGMTGAVIFAVVSVTKGRGETYPDLITRAAADPLGRLVKLADNWVNLSGLDDLARLGPEQARTADRLRKKYTAARERLLSALLAPRTVPVTESDEEAW